MEQSDRIEITGDVDLTELTRSLQAKFANESSGIELEPRPGQSVRRTGLEVATLFAVAKGLAALTPLIVGILNYIRGGNKSGGASKTPRRLKIVAQDDAILEVPEDTSGERLKELLESQPKFQNPKQVLVV